MPEVKLETPGSHEEIYIARDGELGDFEFRPVFTGDVFRLDSRLVALVQHPCAMRKGADLVERLLVSEVIPNRGGVPADWSRGSFKNMFLPGLSNEPLAIAFDELDVLPREQIASASRMAILSNSGVDVLVQRWLYHNSRVVIPTITINAQSVGPFEEADLLGDASADLVGSGFEMSATTQMLDDWFGRPHTEDGASRREMLSNPQQRSVVRSALRRQVKDWVEAGDNRVLKATSGRT